MERKSVMFSELNDPIDQRARFEEQLELGKRR